MDQSQQQQHPYQQVIRSKAIAEELELQGFSLTEDLDDNNWIVEAPTTMSNTKARKVISTIINLYEAAKNLNKAQVKYDGLVMKLEELTTTKEQTL